MEPNCEKLHAIGVRESYTYLIDSDGTGEKKQWPRDRRMRERERRGGRYRQRDRKTGKHTESVFFLYVFAFVERVNSSSSSTFIRANTVKLL